MRARGPGGGRRGYLGASLGILIVAAISAPFAPRATPGDQGPEDWPVGRPVPISVANGRARFVAPSRSSSDRLLVVVSSLARTPGSYPIRISARPASRQEAPRLADDGPRRPPRLLPGANDRPPGRPAGPPSRERLFCLPVRDGDPASPSNHIAVRARLGAFGDRVAVYVDPADSGRVEPETLRDVVATFEERIYPLAQAEIGTARDVDGDGRFAVLMSGWLGHLDDGRLAVDGFVRGSDFEGDRRPPLGNRGDMMYLNAAMRSGPHLRTVLAHEYTHAVTFCRKALGPARGDEEGWLDEALAHLGEDLHGFSRSNLDYRVAAFLAAPERYRLLVDDYGSPALIRSHGHRGSAYRFLRWCADRHGPALLGTLIRSDLRGVPNLESATGSTFAALYRGWSVGLYLEAIAEGSPDDRDPPRASRLAADGDDLADLDGTTSHFAVVEGSTEGAVAVEVSGPPAADLQVTAVRLPADLPRVDLSVAIEPIDGGGRALRARIRGRDEQTVRLESLRWFPAVPPSDAAERASLSGRIDGDRLRQLLGRDELPGRGRIVSDPIALGRAPEGPLVVLLAGRDGRGRRVVSWAEVGPSKPAED